MLWPIIVLTTALGLAVGSFLNVVAYRVPRGESVAFPPSHCPRCETPIRARHNVPVLGWLVLRGRCAACAQPISARYPLVEAGTAAAMAVATVLAGPSPLLPAYLVAVAAGVLAALILTDKFRSSVEGHA